MTFKKSIVPVFALTSIFISCNETKQAANNNIIEREAIKPTYSISVRTNQLLAELEKELENDNKNIQNFIPSQKLIEEYSIQQKGDTCYLQGFVKVSKEFDKAIFESTGVTFGQPSGKFHTVRVPLYYLPAFLKQRQIEYFEISEELNNK